MDLVRRKLENESTKLRGEFLATITKSKAVNKLLLFIILLLQGNSMSNLQPIAVSDSDSEQEDDSNLPSRDECEARCQAFAEITGTDTALGMFYLQNREWDVDRALNDYFAENEVNSSSTRSDAPDVSHSGTVSTSASSSAGAALRETRLEIMPYLTLQPPVMQQRNEKSLRILSWNIDGLDPDNLKSRTEGMCSVLLQEAPEIIFLQEIVSQSLKIIQSKCDSTYQVFLGIEDQNITPNSYFTAILLRKDCVSVKLVNVAEFPTSCMSRTLLVVQCEVKKMDMALMTSHLESTAEHSVERMKQLQICFRTMLEMSKYETVIFGGDLNLRDKELTGQSAKPIKIHDLWEVTGKRPEAKFTWDLTMNDNKQYETKFQPRFRFDRLYIRHASLAKLKPVYFELVGIQRLASCRRFPSDHWGILAHFDILS